MRIIPPLYTFRSFLSTITSTFFESYPTVVSPHKTWLVFRDEPYDLIILSKLIPLDLLFIQKFLTWDSDLDGKWLWIRSSFGPAYFLTSEIYKCLSSLVQIELAATLPKDYFFDWQVFLPLSWSTPSAESLSNAGVNSKGLVVGESSPALDLTRSESLSSSFTTPTEVVGLGRLNYWRLVIEARLRCCWVLGDFLAKAFKDLFLTLIWRVFVSEIWAGFGCLRLPTEDMEVFGGCVGLCFSITRWTTILLRCYWVI